MGSKSVNVDIASSHTLFLDDLDSEDASKKTKKVSNACNSCRKRHARCNGQNPCNHCARHGKQCDYTLDDRRRKQSRNEQTWALETQIEELQSTLNILRYGSETEATETLRQLRLNLPDTSPNPPSQGSQQLLSESSNTLLIDSMDAQHMTYTLRSLPSESTIQQGAKSFFMALSGIFWVMDPKDFTSLCDNVYRSSPSERSVVDLAEMCSFAAAGRQYDIQPEKDDWKEILFRTAAQHIHDVIELSSPRAVRILACLAIYGVLDRRKSARSIVRLAIQILRWSTDIESSVEEKRIFRTVVILECWLSTLSGYITDLSNEEIILVQSEMTIHNQTVEEIGAVKLMGIAYLRTIIIKSTWYSSVLKAPVIEESMTRLDNWRKSLPGFMELSSLMENTSGGIQAFNPRAILLTHVLYLGAVISLHRRILIAMADNLLTGHWRLDASLQDRAGRYYQSTVEAARSSARIFIFSNLGNDVEKTFLRCWICSFEVLTSCTVLLFDIAIKLNAGHSTEPEIEHDLDRTTSCLNLLGAGNGIDTAVEKLSDIGRALRAACTGASDEVSSSASSPLVPGNSPAIRQDPPTLAKRMITKLSQILKSPFSYGT